jgi:hypothetical protein
MGLSGMSADRLDETIVIVGPRLESRIALKHPIHDSSRRE